MNLTLFIIMVYKPAKLEELFTANIVRNNENGIL